MNNDIKFYQVSVEFFIFQNTYSEQAPCRVLILFSSVSGRKLEPFTFLLEIFIQQVHSATQPRFFFEEVVVFRDLFS